MATLQIIKTKTTKNGLLRLTFAIEWENSRLVVDGFRYNPEDDALLVPSFAGRKGGQVPTVQVKGELGVKMVQLARKAYSENGKGLKGNEEVNY